MNTPQTWTPPPKMPSDLPPLPMGKNGRPLVYLGMGLNFKAGKRCQIVWYYADIREWMEGTWNTDEMESHYAAESDSEVCRLNGWGDFAPKAEPVNPRTILETYRAEIAARLPEAARVIEHLRQSLTEWQNYQGQLIDAQTQLEVGDALSRKAWYDAGRNDGRHHKPARMNFPKYP